MLQLELRPIPGPGGCPREFPLVRLSSCDSFGWSSGKALSFCLSPQSWMNQSASLPARVACSEQTCLSSSYDNGCAAFPDKIYLSAPSEDQVKCNGEGRWNATTRRCDCDMLAPESA